MAKFIQYPQEFSNSNWTSVAFNNVGSVYVAVGNAGAYRVARSADNGVTWTYPLGASDAAQTQTWTAVTWNPGFSMFVAVASGSGTGRIMTSPDGVTWTVRTYGSGPQAVSFNAAASSSTRTVIVGGGGVAADQTITTTDGVTYTSVASSGLRNWTGVSWNATATSTWFAVANDGGTANGAVMTNTESGLSTPSAWTAQVASTPPGTNPWISVAAQQVATGTIVAVASGGPQSSRIMRSTDNGANWNSVDPGVDVNFSYVFATNNGFYALANTGTQTQRILTSPTGATWTVGAALPTTSNRWAGGIGNNYSNPTVIVFVSNSGGSSRILRMTNSTLTLSAPIEINDSYTRTRVGLPVYINAEYIALAFGDGETTVKVSGGTVNATQNDVALIIGADRSGVSHEVIIQDIINANSAKYPLSPFGYIASPLPEGRTVTVTRS